MAFSLIPSCVADSVFALTPELLRSRGVHLVLADLDNTLVSYENTTPSDDLRRWKDRLADSGVALYVVSNSRKSHRCPDFCTALGIPCIRHAGKPGTDGFVRALAESGCRAEETVMVGDQIFTDILGANRAGIASILVKPIAIGKNPFRAVRYAVETPFRLPGKRRGYLKQQGSERP